MLAVRENPELAGMGTTLVAMLVSDRQASLVNIGDSRAYRMRKSSGTFSRLTEDHIYGNLIANADAVPNLPERISRFLDGRADGRSPDIFSIDLVPGDRFLLCSDGLSSYVPEELIRASLTAVDKPAEIADRLVSAALDRGGSDNVTVIVADVHDRRSQS
jgi:serine/threonine protein phosphatase PrpC